MSEASAAVVTTDPGAVMDIVAGRSRQQGFGPRSTHSVSNRVQRQLRCSRRQTQNAASCSKKIDRARRSKGKRASMSGNFSLDTIHGRLILHARTLPRCMLEARCASLKQKCIFINNSEYQVRRKEISGSSFSYEINEANTVREASSCAAASYAQSRRVLEWDNTSRAM